MLKLQFLRQMPSPGRSAGDRDEGVPHDQLGLQLDDAGDLEQMSAAFLLAGRP